MAFEAKQHIGIIVGKDSSPLFPFLVWSKTLRFDGRIPAISRNGEHVKIGDWVILTDPQDPNKLNEPLEAKQFDLYPEKFKTLATSDSLVHISFNLDLKFSDYYDHPYFGTIQCSNNLHFKEGFWMVTIENSPKDYGPYQRTEWKLKHLSEPPPSKPSIAERTAIGIVASRTKQGGVYVWSKETTPGDDFWIPNADGLEIGRWLNLTLRENQLINYSLMTPQFKTFATKSSIRLELEMWIDESNEIKDFYHPFVGLIINTTKPMYPSGKYNICISRSIPRVGKDGHTKSVWFLQTAKLVDPPIKQLPSLPTDMRFTTPYQIMRPEERNVKSPRPIEMNHSSVPLHYQLQRQLNIRQELPHLPPLPVDFGPHSSGLTTVTPTIQKYALITEVITFNEKEHIYFWTLDDHKQGEIFLSVPAEKLGLQRGVVICGSAFSPVHHGQSYRILGDNFSISNDRKYSFVTRSARDNAFEVRVYAEDLQMGDKYPTIYHEHFGTIIDNLRMLSRSGNLKIKFHFWIRRVSLLDSSSLDKEYRWVISEKID